MDKVQKSAKTIVTKPTSQTTSVGGRSVALNSFLGRSIGGGVRTVGKIPSVWGLKVQDGRFPKGGVSTEEVGEVGGGGKIQLNRKTGS